MLLYGIFMYVLAISLIVLAIAMHVFTPAVETTTTEAN